MGIKINIKKRNSKFVLNINDAVNQINLTIIICAYTVSQEQYLIEF